MLTKKSTSFKCNNCPYHLELSATTWCLWRMLTKKSTKQCPYDGCGGG